MNRPLWVRVVPVLLVVVTVFVTCKKNGTGGDGADDGNNPYNIVDLTVAAVTDSTVKLKWTATGDDADQGTATSYDIRYHHAFINDANWDSAVQITGEPHPSPAGQKDSMTITGLKKDSTYFFKVRICDEANNCAMSGCASGTCFTDMVVTFPDPNLEAAVRIQIAKPTGNIMKSDLMHSPGLDANGKNISDLTGIEHWQNLQGLLLADNQVTDLTPLSGLINLRYLGVVGNGLSNISPVSGLVNLEVLHIRANPIKDIAALAVLPKLHLLDMTQDSVSDLEPLVTNADFGINDTVWLQFNPLSQHALDVQVPALKVRGVTVIGLP